MPASTAMIFAARRRPGSTGAVATRSGASSPETASQARPPPSWPAAMTMTGTTRTRPSVALAVAHPEKERRRHQVENLHEALRQEPGIAEEKPPFLADQRRAKGERTVTPRRRAACLPRRSATPDAATAIAAKRPEKAAIASARSAKPKASTAASGPGSPITARTGIQNEAVGRGKHDDEIRGDQELKPRKAAEIEDRHGLDADDEERADDRRHDLRGDAGAGCAEGAEEDVGERRGDGGGAGGKAGHGKIGGEPARARRAAPSR